MGHAQNWGLKERDLWGTEDRQDKGQESQLPGLRAIPFP
jgi:hypothetical protein